jgi:hypothetical protein
MNTLEAPGRWCFVQNQTGSNPNIWDRTGLVVESHPKYQYTIKIDGSGRLTSRNRRFLLQFQPATMQIQPAPPTNLNDSNVIGTPSDDPQATDQVTPLEDVDASPVNTMPVEPAEPNQLFLIPLPHQTTQPQNCSNGGTKVPAALIRLLSHDMEGLQEGIKPPEEGGRRLRKRKD